MQKFLGAWHTKKDVEHRFSFSRRLLRALSFAIYERNPSPNLQARRRKSASEACVNIHGWARRSTMWRTSSQPDRETAFSCLSLLSIGVSRSLVNFSPFKWANFTTYAVTLLRLGTSNYHRFQSPVEEATFISYYALRGGRECRIKCDLSPGQNSWRGDHLPKIRRSCYNPTRDTRENYFLPHLGFVRDISNLLPFRSKGIRDPLYIFRTRVQHPVHFLLKQWTL